MTPKNGAGAPVVEPADSFRPEFKQIYRVEVLSRDRVILVSERCQYCLRGTAYASVAPLLDGRHTVAEIVEKLDGTVAPLHVFQALDELLQAGHIADASTSLKRDLLAFWDSLDTARHQIAENLESGSVSIHAFGDDIDTHLLELALESIGITRRADASHHVVLTDDYCRSELNEFVRTASFAGQPWLLCKPLGAVLWFGPLFVPGQTGCIECLQHRLFGHGTTTNYFAGMRPGGARPAPLVRSPSTELTAMSIIGTEIARWLAQNRNDNLKGRIVSMDTSSLSQSNHELVRRPQCSSCGNPEIVTIRQWQAIRRERLTSVEHRCSASAEHTYRRLQHHISRITGIVRTIIPLTTAGQEQAGVHSTAADHIFADKFVNQRAPTNEGRARSGGKGKTESEARLSALCESLERYSGMFQGDEARVRASANELGSKCIHPNECMLFSDRQYAGRDAINLTASRSNWVPEAFDPSVEYEWSPVWSLSGGEHRYVPTAFCYYNYPEEPEIARAGSNGCAAGASLEEALHSGLLELIERDSVAIWWYNRLNMPGVDLRSFGDSWFDRILAYYEEIGRDLWVLDVTSDISVPAFAAVSRRTDRHPEDIILGFGANPDGHAAIRQSLIEVNQSLPAVHPNSPTDNDSNRFVGADRLEWWKTATVDEQPYLAPDDSVATKKRHAYRDRENRSVSDLLDECLNLVRDRGLDVYALDQSRPDTGLHVARVIIPGSRPFWPRFAEGRLYDVPVKMGWIDERLQEEELNPHSIYF